MSIVTTHNQHYRNIANALRRNGINRTLRPEEMPGAVEEVSGGITPTGKIEITENADNIDVSQYALAKVNVQGSGAECPIDLPTHNLPSGYTEYLYLENSGTQYLNTGIVFTENPTVETWLWHNMANSADLDIMGVTTAKTGGFIVDYKPSEAIFYRYGTSTSSTFRKADYPNIMAANLWRYAKFSTNIVFNEMLSPFEEEYPEATAGSFASNTQEFFLFKGRTITTNTRFGATKIYDGNELVRYMIPCMRDADSVLGMYDTVNDEFYTNAGTGSFTGGALT